MHWRLLVAWPHSGSDRESARLDGFNDLVAVTLTVAMPLMQFFSPEWRDGALDDADYESAFERYESRLGEIRSQLPHEMTTLLDATSLHDAQIRSARFDGKTLDLKLRVGDLQVGYSDLDLQYREVEVLDGIPSVAEVLGHAEAEIIQDEVDVLNDGALEHRFSSRQRASCWSGSAALRGTRHRRRAGRVAKHPDKVIKHAERTH